MANKFSSECSDALKLLARSRNVLISGPPGTGKSRLLAEVAAAFITGPFTTGSNPVHNPNGGVPIPPPPAPPEGIHPAPNKKNRKVFRTVFHQNSKNREFISGVAPVVIKKVGQADFRILSGILYRASEHAKLENGASLLIIDEINRGPAVQVFGGAIVAIEPDKRLSSKGTIRDETQFFEILDPITGELIEYALPHDLYLLAAMNQADASVEPLDVAFLRRWEPLRLSPDVDILLKHYNLVPTKDALPDVATETAHALRASAQALNAVNRRISLGRGPEFQIGHGVLMSFDIDPGAMNFEETLTFLCVGWAKVLVHVSEVFFGDIRGIAATLNALNGPAFNPFKLSEATFADELRFVLDGPANFTVANIYAALRAIAQD